MGPDIQLLREAMQRGEVLLCTRERDILAADLAAPHAFVDVTATVWNPTTADWHQHFIERLDAASLPDLLALNAHKCLPAPG